MSVTSSVDLTNDWQEIDVEPGAGDVHYWNILMQTENHDFLFHLDNDAPSASSPGIRVDAGRPVGLTMALDDRLFVRSASSGIGRVTYILTNSPITV